MEETKMSLEKEGSNYADGFGNMPSYKWVTMCDGTLVQKLLEYDFEQAQRTTEQWGEYEKEDMSDLRLVDVDLVKVPYTIEGTGFTGVVKVQNFNADTWEEDLKEIEKRQEDLRNRAGTRDLEMKEETYRKPCQNRGDDLLIEDKDFAVVYNGSVGGTYEVFLKHTEQEIRDHITRYGIGRASEDVKAVAREMTAEEFSELAQRKMPIFQMPNGGLLNLQYNKDKDSLDVGTVTNAGLSVKHSFPFSHDHSMDANISSAYEQLLDMEEYQKEEVQEEHVAKSAFRR